MPHQTIPQAIHPAPFLVGMGRSGYGAGLNRSIGDLYPLWRSRISLWIVFQRRLLLIAVLLLALEFLVGVEAIALQVACCVAPSTARPGANSR